MREIWKPANEKQLVEDHQNRIPLKRLVEIHGGNNEKIRTFLQRNGVWVPYKVGKTTLPEQDIIELYKSDVPIADIAKKYHVSEGPIVGVLNKHGIRKPLWLKHLPYRKMEQLLDAQYFSEIVREEVGLHPIMDRLEIGETLVKKLCEYHDISLSSNSGLVRSLRLRRKRNSVPLTKENFNVLHFKENKSLQDISSLMGVSPNYLRWKIREWGISSRDTRLSLKFRSFLALDNSEIQRLVDKTPITQLFKEYEVSFERFRRELASRNIKIPTRFVSLGEKSIGDLLEQSSVVERNNRKIIYPYEIDMFLPEHNVAIEYCGLYWHSELNGRGKNYHIKKLEMCNKKGIRLITIFEDEYINNAELVESKILSILNIQKLPKIHARKCYVKEISTVDKRNFLNKHHLQGNDISSIKLGLFYRDDLVAVMTFAKPSRSRTSATNVKTKGLWELNRYAADTTKIVVGGAGKLLSHFKRNYDWTEIYSYADKRWSEGDLYYTLGFEKSSDTPPNYWYVPRGYYKREYRYNYTKYKLIEQGFDANKSESVIMKERGFTRVWDCGHHKFSIKNPAC
jgi:hypothetical protein